MRIVVLYFVLFILSITTTISIAASKDGVEMFLDFARFRYDENNTYLEIYYLVDYIAKDSLASTKNIWLEFSLTDIEKDSIVASSSQELTLESSNLTDKVPATVKGGLIKVVLPAGMYLVKMVRLDDNNEQKLDSIQYEFKAAEFEKEKIAVSDIELSSKIIPQSKNKDCLFYKNTMEVFPNPTRIFGKHNPVLFYYLELYNLQNGDTPEIININAVISDTDGHIRANKSYQRKRGYESLVECGQFNVSKLEEGLYTLIFAVVDSTRDYSVYNRSNFYIVNPDVILATDESLMESFAESEFSYLPEDVLDKKFDQIQYIATKSEIDVYKWLDTIESKRLFLYKFWKEREKEKQGYKDEYYERVKDANELYAYSNREGWQSDRGRIYIVYGEPSHIRKKPHNPDERPYEVWFYYDLEGGVKFLFVDETGFGDYRLITSTMRGEMYDAQYDEILRREQ